MTLSRCTDVVSACDKLVWDLQLKEGLLPFIKELREKGKAPDASVLAGTFDSAAQVRFSNPSS